MKKIFILLMIFFITFSSKAIDCILIKTIDYSFKEKWNKTPATALLLLTTCDRVYKQQSFFISLVVSDYAADTKGISNVEYSLKITAPDNSVYFYQENLPSLKGKILNKDNMHLSNALVNVRFEDKDAFGKYSIEVKVNDLISGKSKSVRSDIELSEIPSFKNITINNDDEFMNWFNNYYMNPHPESALAYYLYYANSKLSEADDKFWPIFSLFNEIFSNNPFLLNQIADCFNLQEDRTKIYLVYLIQYSKIDDGRFLKDLKGIEGEAFMKVKEESFPDIYGELNEPTQLDMLWSVFFATGSYKPILKFIKTLDYAKYQKDYENFSRSKKTEADKLKVIKYAMYKAIVWSLNSNCHQHRLVCDYCKWAEQFEDLTKIQKKELFKINRSK